MTGLDLLRDELKKRGFSKTQRMSSIVGGVLDILANTDTVHTDISEAEHELEMLKREIEKEKNNISQKWQQLEDADKEFNKNLREAKEYIAQFEESLKECETAEGRDKLFAAQMFVNSVNKQTVYDNTAFIIGLGAILSGGKIGAMQELKQINQELFNKTLPGVDRI